MVGDPGSFLGRRPSSLAEKTLDVFPSEAKQRLVVAFDRAVKDLLLLLLQLQNLLLDRALRHETNHLHGSGLPDSVRALHRLQLGGRVPPGVEQHDIVCFLQVQALASDLQRDEEDPKVI